VPASNKGYVTIPEVKCWCESFDDLKRCLAVDGAGCYPDNEAPVVFASYARVLRTGVDMNVDLHLSREVPGLT
jgi:hypothetical protein